jgi:hypothetical protein
MAQEQDFSGVGYEINTLGECPGSAVEIDLLFLRDYRQPQPLAQPFFSIYGW